MTILLRWLIDNAWILYVACGVGVLIYVVRALTAHRERGLALFTLEREAATARVVQSWSTMFVFLALAAIIFVATQYVLPEVPLLDPSVPLPTATLMAGVEPITPSPGPSPTPRPYVSTPTPLPPPDSGSSDPTALPAPPTAPAVSDTTPSPSPEPTQAPLPTEAVAQPVSGDVSVQFGDFARLVGYTVSSAATSTRLPLQLTLYWQAMDGQAPVDYLVFTHLIADDGHLIGQHDGPPGGGGKPTTSWVAGESVIDVHTMEFKDSKYTGGARIVVGMYSPDGERALTNGGVDHFILPVVISIIPE